MNTAILTEEQVEQLNHAECRAAVELLHQTYDMELPLDQLSPEEWDSCDAVCNTLLWLTDRIARFEDPRIFSMPSMFPNEPVATVPRKRTPVATKSKPGRAARQFRIATETYADIRAASLKTGITVATLQRLSKTQPDRYEYLPLP
jgi:hypothetical protein